jgi:hypothetical protein
MAVCFTVIFLLRTLSPWPRAVASGRSFRSCKRDCIASGGFTCRAAADLSGKRLQSHKFEVSRKMT